MVPSDRPVMPFSRHWRDTVTTGTVTALLALFWWLAVTASIEKSHTSDELPHITAGYAFDRFGDFRMHPENGVLPQRLFGLPVLTDDARFPMDPELWRSSNYWLIGWDFFYANNNLTDWIIFRARAVNALLGVALGLLIFTVARSCYGRRGALLAVGFYAFAPNFLAHSGLATSDIAATLFLTFAAVAFWRHLLRRDLTSGLLAGGVSGLAMVAKFNGVLLLPIYTLLALTDAWLHRETAGITARRLALGICLAAAQGLAAALVIWALFDFRYSPRGTDTPEFSRYFFEWKDLFAGLGWKRNVIEFLRAWHLLPEAWIHGLANVLAGETERPAFFAGEHSLRGWWQFFPALFLTKTTLAMLIALSLAGVGAMITWRRGQKTASTETNYIWPVAITALVVGSFAVTSNLNIGDRHILAVYPSLFVALGSLARAGWLKHAALALLIGHGVESSTIRPHYLAFFNAFAGGPAHAYRLFSDSSLDWGQDLPALRHWLGTHRRDGEHLYLGYFGTAWPPHYGVRPNIFLPAPTYLVTPRLMSYELTPGLYCLSATVLNEVYSPYRGPWTPNHERTYQKLKSQPEANYSVYNDLRFSRLCKYLQSRAVDDNAGYSILIFRLTPEDIQAALESPIVGTQGFRIP